MRSPSDLAVRPMPDKVAESAAAALDVVMDGATIAVGGFGDNGIPFALLDAVRAGGARHLTIVSINAGRGATGIAALIDTGQVDRIICSFPRTAGSVAFERAYLTSRIALELVPMGTLVERLRAGSAGIAAFYTKVAAGTALAAGKETRTFKGAVHILEQAIRADLALVRADRADGFGNLTYRGVERNLNPVVAKAADRSIAEVREVVALGALRPEEVVTPGAYVDRVVVECRAVAS